MPAENPPPDLQELPFDNDGAGVKLFNERFRYIYEMLTKPGDGSLSWVPGAGGKPGLIYATAKGSSMPRAYRDFALYDATAKGVLYVGVKFGNVRADDVSCSLGAGIFPYPSNFSPTSDPPYVLKFPAAAASGHVWIKVSVLDGDDDTTVTEITVANGANVPVSSSAGNVYTTYLVLGSYAVANNELTIANSDGIGSQTIGFCNGIYIDPT